MVILFLCNGFDPVDGDGEKIIGVVNETGTGDGGFGCYVDEKNTILLLLGGNTGIKLYESNEEQIPAHLGVVKKYRKRNIV